MGAALFPAPWALFTGTQSIRVTQGPLGPNGTPGSKSPLKGRAGRALGPSLLSRRTAPRAISDVSQWASSSLWRLTPIPTHLEAGPSPLSGSVPTSTLTLAHPIRQAEGLRGRAGRGSALRDTQPRVEWVQSLSRHLLLQPLLCRASRPPAAPYSPQVVASFSLFLDSYPKICPGPSSVLMLSHSLSHRLPPLFPHRNWEGRDLLYCKLTSEPATRRSPNAGGRHESPGSETKDSQGVAVAAGARDQHFYAPAPQALVPTGQCEGAGGACPSEERSPALGTETFTAVASLPALCSGGGRAACFQTVHLPCVEYCPPKSCPPESVHAIFFRNGVLADMSELRRRPLWTGAGRWSGTTEAPISRRKSAHGHSEGGAV